MAGKSITDKMRKQKPDIHANCPACPFHRRVGNVYQGTTFPFETYIGGKCIRPDGFCDTFKKKHKI